MTDHTSSGLRLLDAANLRLFRIAGVTRLTIEEQCSFLSIGVHRAFPVSNPDRYIGLLDGAAKDIGLIANPSQLDPDSHKLLEAELVLRYFLHGVERRASVKSELGSA